MSGSSPSLPEVLAKPLMRGWLHLVCFFLALPAGVLVVVSASTDRARIGAAVYAVGLVGLFGVSGFYHRGRWSAAGRRLMQKLDHGTIFIMIAGSYTPLCLLAVRGWMSWALLAASWSMAVIGVTLAFTPNRATRFLRGALYIVMGWTSVLAAPQLVRTLSVAELVLMAVGGLLFTVGAVFLLTHWPDPIPHIFGYHEVWHVLVVAAVVCHFVAISSVVNGPLPT